jgi:DNA glycosylase AlkZ-like
VASGQWSLGVRVAGSTADDIAAAFERRELIRTWPMRQTVHIIPAVDASWMLHLTGRRALDTMIRRRQVLELLPADLGALETALATILASGEPMSRKELLERLAGQGIPTDGQRGYHALLYASLVGLTCIGPQRSGSQTIVLLSAWAPVQRELTRDEALAELALRYFRSHGPARLHDFAGWTGLTVTDARRAITLNDGRLVPLGDGTDQPWVTSDLADAISAGLPTRHTTVALPGFDEFVLGYKDRSLHGDDTLLDRVVPGGNGIFRATVVRSGAVIATWTRSLVRDRVEIAVSPFSPLSATARREAERAFDSYGAYLGRRPVVRFEN